MMVFAKSVRMNARSREGDAVFIGCFRNTVSGQIWKYKCENGIESENESKVKVKITP